MAEEVSRTSRSINNIIGGLMFKLIAMLFPFIIKSVMINTIGVKYLGINNLFSSILMVLSLSELGVGSALVYNMYKPMAEKDTDRICALLKVYRDFYRIIGIIIMLIGLALLPFLKYLIKGDYPNDINIYWLYMIYLVNTGLSYLLFAYKNALWEASQQNGLESRLAALTNTIMYIAQILALIFTHNYYIYIIFLPLCTLLQNFLRCYRVNKMFPDYKCRGDLGIGFIKELFIKVKALLGHKIGTTIITSADSIVISSILGLDILAIYGNYYQIINSLIGLVTVLYVSITASVGNSIVTGNKKKTYSTFKSLNLFNNWIVGWFSICLLCLYQPFMNIWMGEDLMFSNSIMILFVIYFYAWLTRRIGLTYKDAAGMWEQDFWKPYVGAVVNIVANIILCKTIGIQGALISTIVVMLFIYLPWETKVLFKNLFEISSKEYILKMVIYAAVTVIGGIITYTICILIPDLGIATLILKAVICVIVPNVIFIIGYYRTTEFKDLKIRALNTLAKRSNVSTSDDIKGVL